MILILRKSDRELLATAETIKEAKIARQNAGCETVTEMVGVEAYRLKGIR